MKNMINSITAKLAVVLLTLVMITGSFSAFVFADVSADEAGPGQDNEPSETTEEMPADGNVTDPAEEPAAAPSEGTGSGAGNEGSSGEEAKKFTVTYSQVPNGNLSVTLKTDESETSIASGDAIDLPGKDGDRVIFTGTPDAGYVIKQFTITNGSETTVFPGDLFEKRGTNQISLKLSLVKGNMTFAAEFEVRKYKVEAYSDDDGSVTVDKTRAAEGETVTVNVVPAKGYRIKNVAYVYSGDPWDEYVYLEKDPATGMYSFRMPARDVFVEAGFFMPLTVTVKESKGGSVTLTDRATGKEIKSGDEVEPFLPIVVSAEAESGYKFDKWQFTSADGNTVSFFKKGSYFRMTNADVTVEAVFTRISSEDSSGSGSGSGGGSSTSSSSGSSGNYYQYAEAPAAEELTAEELTAEKLTEEGQQQLDVTPIVARVVAETVLTATTATIRFMD